MTSMEPPRAQDPTATGFRCGNEQHPTPAHAFIPPTPACQLPRSASGSAFPRNLSPTSAG